MSDFNDFEETEIDDRPLCWVCGWPMEWRGMDKEIEYEDGEAWVFYEPIYECINPDCEGEKA